MNIRKIIKSIIVVIMIGFLLLMSFLYILCDLGPRLITSIACNQYVSKNYKNLEVINREYESQVAFVITGGKYKITLKDDDYEFDVVAENWFLDNASITDYYGSANHLSDESSAQITEFIVNHKLFEKYNYTELNTAIYDKNEEGFITKEKADENTFEIIQIYINIDFDSKHVALVNVMESQEKHKLLNDIYDFLESKDIKFQKLELIFNFNAIDEELRGIPDVTEILTKCSNEFLNYQENKELSIDRNGNQEKEVRVVSIIKDIYLPGWIIEDVFIDSDYYDINIVLKNQEDNETVRENIRMFFQSINTLLEKDGIKNDILLILNYDAHEKNERHCIKYNRV